MEERSEPLGRGLIAEAGVRGRPITRSVLSAHERAYLKMQIRGVVLPGPSDGRNLPTKSWLQ
jgi:hypothetical protein